MNTYFSLLEVAGERFSYVDLHKLLDRSALDRLPYSIRLLLENVARCSPEALKLDA